MLIVLLFTSILTCGWIPKCIVTCAAAAVCISHGLAILAWPLSSRVSLVYSGRHLIGLAEIPSMQIVHNKWWSWSGININPGVTLYNVSGLDAVWLRLKIGNIHRIGTDEVRGLAAASTRSLNGRTRVARSS